jgi:hypothetical protein
MRKENVLFQNERQITRAEYAQTGGVKREDYVFGRGVE